MLVAEVVSIRRHSSFGSQMLSCLASTWEEVLLCETDSGLATDLFVPFSAKKNI